MVDNGFVNVERYYGLIINFHDQVEVTESFFTISIQTLITNIGGIMGVGQILTWLLNKCFDCCLFANEQRQKFLEHE